MDLLEMTSARPGASDENREEWLAERRTGITATEVKELLLGTKTPRRLAEEKLGRRADAFRGNAFTVWGKLREPVIAEEIRTRFDIEPESRVWHSAHNPRFLASPDGIGLGFDGLVLAEAKTTGNDKTLYGEHFTEAGYLAQMVWAMHVMDAERCLYAWEWRLGRPGEFEPGEVVFTYPKGGSEQVAWVYREEHAELEAKLVSIADEFLALLDEMAAEPFDEPEIDEEIDTLALNYLAALDAEKEAAAAKDAARAEIKKRLGGREFLQETAIARVLFNPAKDVQRPEMAVDVEAAKADDPETWAELQQAKVMLAAAEGAWDAVLDRFKSEVMVTKQTRETLTITRGKGLRA